LWPCQLPDDTNVDLIVIDLESMLQLRSSGPVGIVVRTVSATKFRANISSFQRLSHLQGILWECITDEGPQPYDAADTYELEIGHTQGSETIVVRKMSGKYEVNLRIMTEIGLSTNGFRKVQRSEFSVSQKVKNKAFLPFQVFLTHYLCSITSKGID